MALTTHEQFLEAANRGQNILVALPHAAGIDEIGAGLSLAAHLKNLGKSVDIVSDGFSNKPEHTLLAGADAIRPALGALQHFVISVPVQNVKLENIAYTIAGDELRIMLTPQAENWRTEHVRAEATPYRYDLAITVGAQDMDALGAVYRSAPDFWRTVPILNIDHSPANERFGAVNIVDMKATAISEIVYDLLRTKHPESVQGQTATALLAGVIGKTRNFKTENVSPKTLTIAADLVTRGAERERIVGELYRTKNIETLRLWGRALVRLRTDSKQKLAWTLLTRQDFVSAGAKEEELTGIVEDLLGASPDIALSCVLYEGSGNAVHGILHTHQGTDVFAIAEAWQPVGSPRQVLFSLPAGTSLVDAERLVLEKIRKGKKE